ncbi:MAG TPA: hypothetical protein VFF24_15080 [Acidimicrobiia bacterium]|nr:hypothetical protein [Acidimicrobiia bacterium]
MPGKGVAASLREHSRRRGVGIRPRASRRGADRFFLSTDDAVRAAETRLMAGAIPLESAPEVIVIEEKL